MLAWASNGKIASGRLLGSWIFNQNLQQPIEQMPKELIQAITPNAVQRDWKTPSEFPCCPQVTIGEPIEEYHKSLIEGAVFCVNYMYSSDVYKSIILNGGKSIYVMTHLQNGMKEWALAEITFEDNMYVHTSKGTFFEQNGAEKYYCLTQGLEWTGGDGIDDYC